MALANYADLVAAVQNWMDWSDSVATARIPECVSLFESYAARKLRVRQMLKTTTLTPVAGTAALPSDFVAIKNVIYTGTPVNSLEEMEDFLFEQMFGDTSATGPARAFCIRGSNLLVGPADSTNLTLVYYSDNLNLQSDSTNWLMTSHPDAYLFGTLVEANAFRVNAQAAQLWKARRDEVCQEITDYIYRGPAPQMRVIGNTP